MKKITHNFTESFIPVLLLLSAMFLLILFIQYRADSEADKAHYIYVTSQASSPSIVENEMNSVIEIDFSDDPRITKAQELIKEEKFTDAENIYFSILVKEPSAQIHNWLGTLYLKQKYYDKAVVSFSNSLKLNASYYRARYNRALTYTALDEPKKAISDYKEIIHTFDSHVSSHLNLGLIFYKNKEYALAIDEFKKTISISSGNKKIKAYYLLGKSYAKISPMQKESAIKAFNEAIRLKPNHVASRLALIDLGYSRDNKGNKKRLDSLNGLVELEPDNIDLQFEVIKILIKLKKNQDAISKVEQILIMEPSSTKAYFLLGRLHYLENNYDMSLLAYEKVHTIRAEFSPELLFNMGLVYTKMKLYSQAQQSYQKSLQLRSDYPEAYYNLGLLYLKEKKLEEAKKFFNRAIDLHPNYKHAYQKLASILSEQNQNIEAIKVYKKLIELSPDNISFKFKLAVRYSKIKEYMKAQNIYEEVVQEDETYFIAWLNLGLVQYQMKDYTLSQEALQRAIELEPENDKAQRALAKCYSALENNYEAIKMLRKLLSSNPSDIKARLAYARSFYRLKKRNTALEEYAKVLLLEPNNQVAKKMIEKIKTMKRIENVSK